VREYTSTKIYANGYDSESQLTYANRYCAEYLSRSVWPQSTRTEGQPITRLILPHLWHSTHNPPIHEHAGITALRVGHHSHPSGGDRRRFDNDGTSWVAIPHPISPPARVLVVVAGASKRQKKIHLLLAFGCERGGGDGRHIEIATKKRPWARV